MLEAFTVFVALLLIAVGYVLVKRGIR